MWLERFVIVITSLHRDFLPSSWGMYWPTVWDWAVYLGTLGFFMTCIFLFVRVLPMITIFELRMLLPGARVREPWRNECPFHRGFPSTLRADGGVRNGRRTGGRRAPDA